VFPTGSDFVGIVRTKTPKAAQFQSIELAGFEVPLEDQFIHWLRRCLPELERRLKHGGLSMQDALREGLGEIDQASALNCLVAAMTAPDEWVTTQVHGELERSLERLLLPGLEVMLSGLKLKMASDVTEENT